MESTCANFNAPSNAPRRIHASAEPAMRSAPAIASSPPGSHTLFYRVATEATIDIVRVLHQRMDVDHHL